MLAFAQSIGSYAIKMQKNVDIFNNEILLLSMKSPSRKIQPAGNQFLIIILCIFSYKSIGQVSYEIQFTHDGKIVHGTFSAPSSNGTFPTIIIAPGSGPN